MIYISYATKNTPYVKVAEDYLIPTLKKFNLPYDIAYPENKHSWQANTHMKATIIKQMLLKHKQAIICLDADATIERPPILFKELNDYDIGVHFLDWYRFWKGIEGQYRRHLLSGTMYLNYNEKVLQLLDEWIKENNSNVRWEQRNLEEVLKRTKILLKIYKLPVEYCTIIKFDGKPPDYIKSPVILHHQASRIHKRNIK